MPWNVKLIMIFFALGDVLLVSTEPLRTAQIQIGKPTAVEGEKVEIKCVISAVYREQSNSKENLFHLYKNREKISSLPEPGGMAAVTFIKQDIRKNDAGNYTCMYGKENPGNVKNISHGSSVYLSVQESSYQLTLQLDKHNPMEGMDVSFKCMIPAEFRDAAGKEDFFHLYKNGSLVDSQPDPKGLPGVEFSIKNVKRSDTGNYTCVYGKEKLVNSTNSKRSRPVYLHVTDYMTTPFQQKLTGDMITPTTSIKTQQTNETESYGLGNDIRIFLSLGILLVISVIVGEDFSSRQRKHHGDDTNGQ
ncbi:T-cell-interacting, activating receptor on myeloid cells protein 1-like [Acipenser ruthenus]|uniref:T-cell-interacting, activating receptor on myeloid cells protein 1-like n=1 Tax=Acipenser ruthenus TaxID=7906 RepID=UPI0027418D0E|nr:T-cell-interacting, activating receptor on myeloid cells protein 1-like [Acipenser ruthenus]